MPFLEHWRTLSSVAPCLVQVLCCAAGKLSRALARGSRALRLWWGPGFP